MVAKEVGDGEAKGHAYTVTVDVVASAAASTGIEKIRAMKVIISQSTANVIDRIMVCRRKR